MKKGIIKKFAAILYPHEIGLQMGYVIVEAPPSESKEIAKKIAKLDEARKVYRTFDGKILVNFVVPEKNKTKGIEEFLAKLEAYQMKTYPIYDIIKYESTLPQDSLKELIGKNNTQDQFLNGVYR